MKINVGPARLRYEDVAEILNCKNEDIQILVAKKLLKPLGKPIHNATKYFSKQSIELLASDDLWLSKMTDALYDATRKKNSRRRDNIVFFQNKKGEVA